MRYFFIALAFAIMPSVQAQDCGCPDKLCQCLVCKCQTNKVVVLPSQTDLDAETALALAAAKMKALQTIPGPDINGPTPAGYEKVSINGGPWHFQKIVTPEVVNPKGNTFHAGHNCPSCNRSQYIVSGFNRNGTHNHTCASCGTTWNH